MNKNFQRRPMSDEEKKAAAEFRTKRQIRDQLKLEVELLELNIKYYTYQMQLTEVFSKFQSWQKAMQELQKQNEDGKKEKSETGNTTGMHVVEDKPLDTEISTSKVDELLQEENDGIV